MERGGNDTTQMGPAGTSFVSSFLRAYLRKLQEAHNSLALAGRWEYLGEWFMWGAITEYGHPPPGVVVIEMGAEGHEETVEIRIWRAHLRPNGVVIRGKNLMFDELSPVGQSKANGEPPCSLH